MRRSSEEGAIMTTLSNIFDDDGQVKEGMSNGEIEREVRATCEGRRDSMRSNMVRRLER